MAMGIKSPLADKGWLKLTLRKGDSIFVETKEGEVIEFGLHAIKSTQVSVGMRASNKTTTFLRDVIYERIVKGEKRAVK